MFGALAFAQAPLGGVAIWIFQPPQPARPDSIFGRILTNEQVSGPVLDLLWTWLPTYLAEVERQTGTQVGLTAMPRSMQAAYDLENWPELQLPAVIVVCNGTLGEPEPHGDGSYGAWFEVVAGVMIEDSTEALARASAGRYQAAIETIINAHQDIEGLATDTRWQGRLIELPDAHNRTLVLGTTHFEIFVDDITNQQAGPTQLTPTATPSDPYPDWPTVRSTSMTVSTEPLNE